MTDGIFKSWLERQYQEGLALAAQSDLFDLEPVDIASYDGVPQAWVARFRHTGLVWRAGQVEEASQFEVGIYFPRDHLRKVRPFELFTWIGPFNVWHPNIRPPWVCPGRVAAGIELTDCCYQLFDMIAYHNWSAHDCLNEDASQWARRHQSRFPLDRRPLKRSRAVT